MQKFRFRLEPVLQRRKLTYEQISRNLATTRQNLQTEQQKLADLQNGQSNLQIDLQAKKQQYGFMAKDWTTYVAYIEHLDRQVRVQATVVKQAEERVEQVRQLMQQARTEYEVMEKMKEKAQQEHRYQFLKEEQDFLDEVAGMKSARSDS
ncbi:MAG: flagellar export protein FliJ [Candidatus Poribacteria bacterium]|nr:flagellar export protein FliJ [Candidatus Poribacteria bacterium]